LRRIPSRGPHTAAADGVDAPAKQGMDKTNVSGQSLLLVLDNLLGAAPATETSESAVDTELCR